MPPGEYHAISEKTDALYGQQPELPAGYETTGMAKLRREAHARMPGNGLCTRPAQPDCQMESACETCSYSQTTIEFRPTPSASATTPNNTASPNAPPSSTTSSSKSTRSSLDNDHPYNGGSVRARCEGLRYGPEPFGAHY